MDIELFLGPWRDGFKYETRFGKQRGSSGRTRRENQGSHDALTVGKPPNLWAGRNGRSGRGFAKDVRQLRFPIIGGDSEFGIADRILVHRSEGAGDFGGMTEELLAMARPLFGGRDAGRG